MMFVAPASSAATSTTAANTAASGVRRPAANEAASTATAMDSSVFGLTAKWPEGTTYSEAATPIRRISIPQPGTPAGNIEKNLCTATRLAPPALQPYPRSGYPDPPLLGDSAILVT